MRGKGVFVLFIDASYVFYMHLEGFVLFILGVIKHKSGNPGPVILHILLNTLIYNYSLLLPPISIIWTLRLLTVISMIYNID